jgi:NAD(P)H-flavin reductase
MATATAPPASSPWLPRSARISKVRPEAPGVFTYELNFDSNGKRAKFPFRPGQFNMVYLPGYGEAALSISSDPGKTNRISHTVRIAGNVTRALARLKPQEQVALRGPFGSAWPVDACRGCDLVIACGGVGLAPLRPVVYHVAKHRQDFGRVHLLYGARTPLDLLFTREYEGWRRAGIEVNVIVDLGTESWQGPIGVVPMLMDRLRLDAARTRLFTCGPEVMMRFVIFEALARRLQHNHIYLSMERNMNCAIGLCGHCQLGPAFICKDGPVFTYAQLEPFLHINDF